MTPRAAAAAVGLTVLLSAGSSFAQGGGVPVQLRWRAPANCPQEAQVRQKLRDLLGSNADAAASRLRAEGVIDSVGERFRLTLSIHYDLVNGARVVHATSCEDLGGVAAVTLAILFRAEHSSSAPLTAGDLGGSSAALGDARAAGSENQASESGARAASSAEANKPSAEASRPNAELDQAEPASKSEAEGGGATHWRFLLSVPELRSDVAVLPEPSYGLGFGAGARYDAWRFLISGAFWLAQNYQSESFVGYGAHFGRLSGELSACRGFQLAGLELAPCLLLTVDRVSARATGAGLSSTNPKTAWLSLGAGLQAWWSLGRHAALVFGVNGRVATSRPRFVSDGVGEISQVGPAALGVVVGCDWRF